jgi:D-serine deaminase-like pyridoxal phosphate-dependent protein
MTESQTQIGMNYHDLDTPTLLLDLDLFEANVTRMAEFMAQGAASLRPHAKTNKCPIIARRQVEAGAIGICCQKLGEAEVMGANGISDILITNQIVGPIKIARLVELAKLIDVKPAVDSQANVAALAEAARSAGLELGVVIEVDVGMKRCGVPPGEPTVELAQFIDQTPNVKLRGLMGYEGHCVIETNFDKRKAETYQANKLLVDSKDAVEAAGIHVEIVSAAGTGTYMFAGRHPGITEVEAGSYIFMDTTYREVLTDFEVSLTVLATVISRPGDDRFILDCGSKTLAGDHGTPALLDLPPADRMGLSEEHSTWRYEQGAPRVQIGDKVRVIPGHCCSTVNLHNSYTVIQGEKVVDSWPILAARMTQ